MLRSMILSPDLVLCSLGKGPRSFTLTIMDFLFSRFVTFTNVGMGRYLCAADRPLGLNTSPFAVILPLSWPYHDAKPSSLQSFAFSTDMGTYCLPATT